MMSTEQRQKKVGDAILLERAAGAAQRNFPVAQLEPVLEWLRWAATVLRTEGETGEPDR